MLWINQSTGLPIWLFWSQILTEVLAFFKVLGLFWNEKGQILSGFFQSERAWLWENIVWAAYSLVAFPPENPPSKTKNLFFDFDYKTCWIRRGFQQLSSSIAWRVVGLQISAKKWLVCFVCLYANACFMCICLKTTIGHFLTFLWHKVCVFGEDKLVTLPKQQTLSFIVCRCRRGLGSGLGVRFSLRLGFKVWYVTSKSKYIAV